MPKRLVLSVLALPFNVLVVVPGLLCARFGIGSSPGWTRVAGALVVAAGLTLVVWTVTMFARRGRGTLAPWDPPIHLVVEGPYRHVRNPMISGVIATLFGEATLLGSPAVLVWSAIFVLANALYLPLVEEPGLRRRFGADYDAYRANVPRWFPRLRAWRGPDRA